MVVEVVAQEVVAQKKVVALRAAPEPQRLEKLLPQIKRLTHLP